MPIWNVDVYEHRAARLHIRAGTYREAEGMAALYADDVLNDPSTIVYQDERAKGLNLELTKKEKGL